MIFPIGDTQVKGGHYPYVSYLFLALNVLVFIAQSMVSGNFICVASEIPDSIVRGENLYTLLTSLFLHGGVLHLLGNILFLWVFADNIEAKIGSYRFFFFFLVGGVIASFAHIYFSSSNTMVANCCIPYSLDKLACVENAKACPTFIPFLGASGAISAVIGAYMVMFPNSKIKVLVVFLFRSFHISAWFFLALWFAIQLVFGLGSMMRMPLAALNGIAWWAHIGGFIYGIILGFIFRTFYNFREDLVS